MADMRSIIEKWRALFERRADRVFTPELQSRILLASKEYEPAPPLGPPIKSTKEIVEEIHETFFTEVDRILADAKITRSIETDKQALLDKAARLKALGFSGAKECQEAEAEILRLKLVQMHNEANQQVMRAVNYFQQKYPLYKFITEESVKKICSKYNLIYGPADRYIGTVPDKNLAEMEAFEIHSDDECYETIRSHRMSGLFGLRHVKFISGKEYFNDRTVRGDDDDEFARLEILRKDFILNQFTGKCPDEICAPKSDFNTSGMDIDNFNLKPFEWPDPVVLKPVFFEDNKYYLIKTAWGAEGSDELVVNEKMN